VSEGVLLVNTGTPDAPTVEAIRAYLSRFLSDRHIVDLPAALWKPVLHGIILNTRPRKTIARYQAVWTPDGSPYQLHSEALERAVGDELVMRGHASATVVAAHRYGSPSIRDALMCFAERGVTRLVVVPLYPQSAYSTTGSISDELARQLSQLGRDFGSRPDLAFVESYYDTPGYRSAIAQQAREGLARLSQPDGKLVFSFHSIPLAHLRQGDQYRQQAYETLKAVAKAADIGRGRWRCAFHSRFNDTRRWLGPFLEDVVEECLNEGAPEIMLCCPGFAVDNLETLYDIDQVVRAEVERRGARFSYLPSLNATPAHAALLADVVEARL
jgi:ferrochelatase